MAKVAFVAATLTKWVSFGATKIQEIHGFNGQSADLYLLLIEAPPLANGSMPNGTVPTVKALYLQANNGFKYDFGPGGITLNELFVALSTTEASLTAPGAGGGADFTLYYNSDYACNGNETVVGDLTTNQQTLQVFSEATGVASKLRLLRLEVKENAGTASTLDVYATDAITGLSVSHETLTVSTTNVINFGIDGLSPFQQDANYTKHYGCSVKVTGSANTNIRAIYR